MSAALAVTREGPVVRWTLDRPTRRNALSRQLLAELAAAQEALRNDTTARVVVLAGNGPAFCAGHDLGEMVGLPEKDYLDLFRVCSDVMLGLRRLPQVVVARVHGIATAAGCQLVAACDLAVASEVATFATPGVKIGLFCTTPMVPLVRTVAPRAALEMLLTGHPIPAARAYELGLVNAVVPAEHLDAGVDALVAALLSSSPRVARLGKAAFYAGLGLTEERAYDEAVSVMVNNACLPDAQEGMSAFLGKRPPNWPRE